MEDAGLMEGADDSELPEEILSLTGEEFFQALDRYIEEQGWER